MDLTFELAAIKPDMMASCTREVRREQHQEDSGEGNEKKTKEEPE